ncbi:MAG: DeoR/GlpR transcriptional regulator [Firmicutes bacterium]|nr:DeoR/GlpR transcriptional regulator [Bacillota bacterium]
MLAEERRMKILEMLEEKQSVTTSELSQELNVSEMTIRRDLDYLDKTFALKRTYGGAVSKFSTNGTPLLALRLHIHAEEKKRIAKRAAQMVKDGESIFLDASSTCYYFAQELKRFSNLTVITNSPYLTSEFMLCPTIQVICLGGMLRHSTGSLVGPETEEFLLKLHADKLFIAVKGISFESGLTENDPAEAQVKRNKIRVSSEVVLLSDYSKFGKVGLIQVAPLESVTYVVTDDKVPPEYIEGLQKRSIEVIVAR